MMNKIVLWWSATSWKTRLISITILFISVIISAFVFVCLMYLQSELLTTNYRFFRDFSSLVAYDFVNNIDKNNLKDFAERIYLATSSIDYLQLFDNRGLLLFSFPANSSIYKDVMHLNNDLLNLKYHISFSNILISNRLFYLQNSTTNCIIPLVVDNTILGFLQLGFKFSNSILQINKLAQIISSLTFVIVWLLFILGVSLTFFIILEPISSLSKSIHTIALGNFGHQISSSVGGPLGQLVVSVNEMSEHLLYYERNNISQLIVEKIKLESLVSTITDGAILLDTELRILLVNQIAIKFFHWSNKDLSGSMISQYFPAHVNESLLPILNNMIKSSCLENQDIQLQELIINLNNETLKTFRFLFSTICNYNSHCFNGVVVIIQDITRETQLNEAKSQFVSNVSHELRTPLCNIGSFLETLIDYKNKLTSYQKDQFLGIAFAETQRLNSLVNDILDLSRLESEFNYILKPIVLNNTILHITQATQIIAFNKQVRILVELHSSVKEILGDQNSLCQVLSNLISNSLKFTHKSGKIIIRVYPLLRKSSIVSNHIFSPNLVRLEIIDEGIGINKIFQKNIFERFMRIENNVHLLKGTGLGLSIVQNIIYKHNSLINVHSEVGVGTSFWFDLFIVNELTK